MLLQQVNSVYLLVFCNSEWNIIIAEKGIGVHRCGASGSMRACHAAGPGSIPGRDKFPGWVFFGVFPHL